MELGVFLAELGFSGGVDLSAIIRLLHLRSQIFLTAKCLAYHVSLCFCVFYLGFYLDACFCGCFEWDMGLVVRAFRVVYDHRGIELFFCILL